MVEKYEYLKGLPIWKAAFAYRRKDERLNDVSRREDGGRMRAEQLVEEQATEASIRRALPCTWHAFFARFPHLREIQRRAIPMILSGASVIVQAPTASGKTEAIMAPVLERIMRMRQKNRGMTPSVVLARGAAEALNSGESAAKAPTQTWFDGMHAAKSSDFYSGKIRKNDLKKELSTREASNSEENSNLAVLLVAPTKALCNDLYRRLKRPIADSGFAVSLRTGDNPIIHADKLPDVLITTPESFDSLMARKPAIFRNLDTVIIDEIHLLAGAGRGDQLQCLLTRLRKLVQKEVRVCASSATVPELDRIACDFLGENTKTVSCVASERKIHASIHMIRSDPKEAVEDTANVIVSLLDSSPTCKILAFCNSRMNVENIVFALKSDPRIASKVFAHHGSLSKEERLRTEEQFLRAGNAACVATSTLELGIDIGDVDRIVLLGPPPDVPALIQRMGRGCRTQDAVYAICLADCPFNAHRFLHLVACARAEKLFPDPVAIRPTIMVQQALSVCLQNPKGWIACQALYERLAPSARAIYTLRNCEETLDSMAQNGLLRKVGKCRFVLDSKAQFLCERGYMHSMIADRAETDVVDSVTGRTLGSVYLKKSNKEAVALGNDVSLTLGGTSHTISFIRDKKIFVKRGDESSAAGFMALEPPRYSLGLARDFAQFMHIPNDALYVRCVLQAVDTYKGFTPECGDALKIDVPQLPQSTLVDYHVNHFLGTMGGYLLQLFFENHSISVRKGTRSPFFLRLAQRPSIRQFPDEEQLVVLFEMYIRNNIQKFAKLLQPGPWLNLISEETILTWILKSVDVRAYARVLANKPIVVL